MTRGVLLNNSSELAEERISVLIQDRKRLLPEEKERPPVTFSMASWRFRGPKQYHWSYVTCWRNRKALVRGKAGGNKDFCLISNLI